MSLWRSGTSTAPWTAGSLHSRSHLIRRSRGCILRTHRGWCCQPHSDGRSGLEGLGDLQRQTPMINSYTAQLVLRTRDPHWVSVFKVRSKDLRRGKNNEIQCLLLNLNCYYSELAQYNISGTILERPWEIKNTFEFTKSPDKRKLLV